MNFAQNPKSIAQHREIIEALKSGDKEWAELITKNHTGSVRRAFLELWQADGEDIINLGP